MGLPFSAFPRPEGKGNINILFVVFKRFLYITEYRLPLFREIEPQRLLYAVYGSI